MPVQKVSTRNLRRRFPVAGSDPTSSRSAWIKNHSLVLPAPYILQRLMEMLFASLDRARVLLVPCQIGVNELD